ncbi:MAG: Phosphonate ABC transporter permease protein phnE, partial [uncultured Acetobacteraceae bacterium]
GRHALRPGGRPRPRVVARRRQGRGRVPGGPPATARRDARRPRGPHRLPARQRLGQRSASSDAARRPAAHRRIPLAHPAEPALGRPPRRRGHGRQPRLLVLPPRLLGVAAVRNGEHGGARHAVRRLRCAAARLPGGAQPVARRPLPARASVLRSDAYRPRDRLRADPRLGLRRRRPRGHPGDHAAHGRRARQAVRGGHRERRHAPVGRRARRGRVLARVLPLRHPAAGAAEHPQLRPAALRNQHPLRQRHRLRGRRRHRRGTLQSHLLQLLRGDQRHHPARHPRRGRCGPPLGAAAPPRHRCARGREL